ncbi:MAG: NifB/NifX family molybdenum-iron cluster-binding protein [Pseudomonadota bacterium]
MKIAVTSQNRREITEHAGRCRKFWLYDVTDHTVHQKELLELPKEQSFHESAPQQPHPLDDITVLITGGMGQGMVRRLANMGIIGIVTEEKDPDAAVNAYLAGRLHTRGAGQGCHQHHHGV